MVRFIYDLPESLRCELLPNKKGSEHLKDFDFKIERLIDKYYSYGLRIYVTRCRELRREGYDYINNDEINEFEELYKNICEEYEHPFI